MKIGMKLWLILAMNANHQIGHGLVQLWAIQFWISLNGVPGLKDQSVHGFLLSVIDRLGLHYTIHDENGFGVVACLKRGTGLENFLCDRRLSFLETLLQLFSGDSGRLTFRTATRGSGQCHEQGSKPC